MTPGFTHRSGVEMNCSTPLLATSDTATVKQYLTVQALRLAMLTGTHKEGLQVALPLFYASWLSADVAEKLAMERYESFDAARREAARVAADTEHVAELEQVERQLEGKGKKK